MQNSSDSLQNIILISINAVCTLSLAKGYSTDFTYYPMVIMFASI